MSDNERDRVVEPEAGVVEGQDDVPRQPAPPLDPYTPDTGPDPGEERAYSVMRWAWIPVLIAIALIVIALLR